MRGRWGEGGEVVGGVPVVSSSYPAVSKMPVSRSSSSTHTQSSTAAAAVCVRESGALQRVRRESVHTLREVVMMALLLLCVCV